LKKIEKTETKIKHSTLTLKQTVNDVLVGSLGLVVTMIEHTFRLDSTGFAGHTVCKSCFTFI